MPFGSHAPMKSLIEFAGEILTGLAVAGVILAAATDLASRYKRLRPLPESPSLGLTEPLFLLAAQNIRWESEDLRTRSARLVLARS
jgi:hypothetical protein